MVFGPPIALTASVAAVLVDRPRTFAIAGLAISGLTCLLIAGLFAFAIVLRARL